MPRVKRLTPAAEWSELSTTAADWKAADPALLATMLGQLHLIRAFEETVLELAGEGLVHGPAHSSIGQEGGAVGSIVGLRSSDAVNGSHRGHHQFLAKALTHVTKGALVPGLAGDPRGGRGPAAHPGGDPRPRPGLLRRARRVDAPAVVRGRGAGHQRDRRRRRADGGGQRLGAAARYPRGRPPYRRRDGPDGHLLRRRRGQHRVGAGDPEPGAAWKLPRLLLHREQRLRRLHHRRGGHRRAAAVGRGRSASASRPGGSTAWTRSPCTWSMERAARRLRAGEGPVVIEALVYRFFHQNGPFPGSAFGYRTREEEAAWRARDPLDRVAAEMTRLGLIDEAGVAAVRAQAVEAMRRGRRGARRAGPGSRRQGRRAAHPPRAVARPGIRRRRHPRRPVGDRGGAHRGARHLRRRAAAREVHRRGVGGDGPADGRGPADHRARRGRAQAQRRHQRGDQGPGREVPGPGPRHADQRERVRRAGRRARARRPVPAGGGVHVPGLPVGGRRPGVQPDRQGQAHVRRQEPGAAGAAHQGRHGLRVRVAAPHGPGGHLRDQRRLADHGPLDPVRLRRADERRAGDRRPGAGARARRPVRHRGRHPGRRPGLPDPVRQGGGAPGRAAT